MRCASSVRNTARARNGTCRPRTTRMTCETTSAAATRWEARLDRAREDARDGGRARRPARPAQQRPGVRPRRHPAAGRGADEEAALRAGRPDRGRKAHLRIRELNRTHRLLLPPCRGQKEKRYCYGISIVAGGRRPISCRGSTAASAGPENSGLETLTNEQALAAFRGHETEGLCHTVWTFRTPFIGGICNCDRTDCLAMKARCRMIYR